MYDEIETADLVDIITDIDYEIERVNKKMSMIEIPDKFLDPIMFADDTNLIYSHNDIKTLFVTVNGELEKIEQWFKANKLSLNVKKTKSFPVTMIIR